MVAYARPYTRPRPTPRRRFYKKKTISKTSKKTKASTVARNSRSIVRLNKRVINAANGHYQTNFQVADVVGLPYTVQPRFPIAFCLEDFTHKTATNPGGGKIYGCFYTGISPDIINTPLVINQWQTVNPAQSFGMALNFRQWADNNNDTASLTAYMPVSVSHTLTFSRASQEAEQADEFVRVDVIKPKRRYLNSKFHTYNMPDALGSFQEMAINNAVGQRNSYNPALWSVKTRWIKLPANQSSVAVALPSKSMKLYHKFPKRLIKLDLDYQASTSTYEDFHLATDPKNQTWVVISASEGSSTHPLRHSFTRTIRYRDQHGVGM